jgi:hypothetical protein
MASNEAIAKAFYLLRRHYPDHVQRYLSAAGEAEALMAAWRPIFGDIEDDLLIAAAMTHIGESQWWPKAAELRGRAFALLGGDALSTGEAWALVCEYIRKVPAEGHVFAGGKRQWAKKLHEIDARVSKAVEAIGGLSYLRTSENVMSDRARFCDAYEAMVKRQEAQARMLPEVRAVVERIAAQRQLTAPEPHRLEAGR